MEEEHIIHFDSSLRTYALILNRSIEEYYFDLKHATI